MAKEAVARAQVNPAVLKRLGSAINERRCWVVRCTWPLGCGDAAGPKGKAARYLTARLGQGL